MGREEEPFSVWLSNDSVMHENKSLKKEKQQQEQEQQDEQKQ